MKQGNGLSPGRWWYLVWVVVCLVDGLTASAQSFQLPTPQLITDRQGLPQAFVESIVQDIYGFIWVATRDGLCRYDGRTFRIFQPDPNGHSSLSFAGVGMLKLDYRGRIWVASERGDLDLFDPQTETFVNFSNQPAYKQLFGLHVIKDIHFDHQGRLWLAFANQGLGCINTRSGKVQRYRYRKDQPNSLRSDHVTGVVEDRQGQIWVATSGGLNRFDSAKMQFVSIPVGSISDSLSGLYIRPNGEFMISAHRSLTLLNPQTGATRSIPLAKESQHWNPVQFATDSRGVVYLIDNGNTYRFSDQDGLQLQPELNEGKGIEHCQSIWIDRSDVLWLGTTGAGIRQYNLRANPFQTATYQRPFHIDLFNRWLGVKQGLAPAFTRNTEGYDFRYTFDRQNGLWFNARSTPFQRLDLTTGQLTDIAFPIPTPSPSTKVRTLYLLATDPQGRIWALHDFQAWWYDASLARWIQFKSPINIPQPVSIWQMVVDQDAFWLATDRAGLYRVDRRTGIIRQFRYQPNDTTSLSNNNLFCLSTDPTDANRLWIGTFGSGLCVFDKRTGKSRRLTVADGLPNNVIYSAISDKQGYLWVGTNKGLARMNRRTFAIRTFTRDDGLLADEFNRFHYLHLPNDRILMGGIDGITSFYPQQIHNDTFQPTVELTTVQVNNQPLRLTADSVSTTSAPAFSTVQVLQHLTLPHDQNFLTIGFAVMQYNKSGKNHYRYRLTGIDKKWVETSQPEAIYTDLKPGHYILNLNASNTSGMWSPHVRSMAVTIEPPRWATWWAYILYSLAILGVGYQRFRSYTNRLRIQQAMTLQQQTLAFQQLEAQRLQEVDEMKTRFFSNITHEFRTPLTLILTPTQQLQQKHRQTDDQWRLNAIEKNAHQLLGLIDQLMDLAKAEASIMSVQESQGDLNKFVGNLVASFQGQADLKQIDLRYKSSLPDEYWFDHGKLEQIVYNTISNALKFTGQGGNVTIELTTFSLETVRLTISDTGIGIPAEKLSYVFERFYQADQASTPLKNRDAGPTEPFSLRSQQGTGIGLALVKELVNLQQGRIDVQSEPGVGTTFTIDLPYRRAVTVPSETTGLTDRLNASEFLQAEESENSDPAPVLLLVEDNEELARFIAQSLPMTYQIHWAANGAYGFERALELMPDLVLSDVLMPVMDGYALCGKLKTDLRTSHIPVIMLTAKGELESLTTGLTQGADDYITKPFHLPELQLRIRNLLYGRRRLREWLRQSLTQPDSEDTHPEPAPADTFLPLLYSLLDKYLDDATFGVDELAAEIGMSRASLYRKIKAISALPANELIQNYRLKRATQYLRHGRTVAETAYLVGFDNPSYFTKCFRKLYQLSPSEFASQGR